MNECQGTEPREVVMALADGQCNVEGVCTPMLLLYPVICLLRKTLGYLITISGSHCGVNLPAILHTASTGFLLTITDFKYISFSGVPDKQ